MNSLTNAENLKKLSEREIELGTCGTTKSWHNIYKDSAWIFVGGLPFDLTEGDVICIFSQYGEIVNINMVRDKKTGKTKGYAFICYEDQRSTILAVDNFNLAKVLQRTLRVDHVKDYRPPDQDDKNADDITKVVRAEGVAPRPITPSESSEDEDLTPLDSKREKKRKKKEKKVKKEKKLRKEKIKEEVESPKHDRRVKEEPKSPTQHRHHQVSESSKPEDRRENNSSSRCGARELVNIKKEKTDRRSQYDEDQLIHEKNNKDKNNERKRNESPPHRDRTRKSPDVRRRRSPGRSHRSPDESQHRSRPEGSAERDRQQTSDRRRRSRSGERQRSRSRDRRRSRSPRHRR